MTRASYRQPQKGAPAKICGTVNSYFRSGYGPYVNFLFRSHIIKCQIAEHLGATINQITNKSLKSFQIPVPPTDDEINAIATVLSDVDALLEGLDRLIAKKRDLKQAAMQQLLTGQTRLPGFTGERKTTPFGAVCNKLLNGGTPSTAIDEYWIGEIPWISGADIMVQAVGNIRRFITPDAVRNSATNVVEKGNLLVVTRTGVGKLAVAPFNVAISQDFTGVYLNPSLADTKFIYYYLDANSELLKSTVQGTSISGITRETLTQVELQLPPTILEQTAIAAVLSDIDAEIDLLEQRRAKTADLKQAMMQELLTGKTRLVAPQISDTEADAVPRRAKRHNWAINEAIVIATLVKHFGSENYPLGRKRYTKLSYLLHRHVERKAEGYLKRAAGPYNPQTKYGGPEKIAKQNGYICEHKGPRGHSGFIAADKVAQAEGYFEKWYGAEVIGWLSQFRFSKNDDLEVLATVDMAIQDLRTTGTNLDVDAVKDVIAGHPEWEAKLDRSAFSDSNIVRAIKQSQGLFDTAVSGESHA